MRLLVVDDQNVVRQALAQALGGVEDIELVVEVESAREALAAQERHRFDVAVIELLLPDRSGPELIRRLKVRDLALRVLVLSASRDEFSVGEAMRAGADGYLSKRAHLGDLLEAIRTVARGRTAVSSDVSAAMVRALQRRESSGTGGDMVAALSERERQVLRLLALGSSAKEVAAQLSISVKTVETHRARLCAKMATHSVADLTRLAVRAGLVEA
jgi:DNA-binding NarL/FixJ family response regulator